MEVYQMLLDTYVAESVSKKKLMARALEDGNLGDYAIQVHSIKSTSKMLGALELSETARKLELAAKDGNRDIIDADHAKMLDMYENLLRLISPDGPGEETDAATDDDAVFEFVPEETTEEV
jgi:HPt (histidine-containing phosphotransfer) domain-containing protein